ncbi:hypothetical protein NKR23_g2137 [Pleurostoma richardsiae]|uniref:Polysaccharide synthase n=1 Tax=Pleurostoma richardsiae TaxID=41990 RepID=A0AA38S3D5_9PEZI|nr:hypothetical protein NKR23_g2137 [Pleurostoma richardsiae]
MPALYRQLTSLWGEGLSIAGSTPWLRRESCLSALLIVGLLLSGYKDVRLWVNAAAAWTYQTTPIPQNPTYTRADVTTVIPTRGYSQDVGLLEEAVESHIRAGCEYIIISVPRENFLFVQEMPRTNAGNATVLVVTSPIMNKRDQLSRGVLSIPESRKGSEKIIITADDDTIIPETAYPWILAPFEDRKVGAVGTAQRARRVTTGSLLDYVVSSVYDLYLQRRLFENLATLNIDRGISCLSGRLLAARAPILADPEFLHRYTSETWRGRKLNADDDNHITEHIQRLGWEIRIQRHRGCTVVTVFNLEPAALFGRCFRWQRTNHRRNLAKLANMTWGDLRRYPWSTFALTLSGPVNYGIPVDITFFVVLAETKQTWLVVSLPPYWLLRKSIKIMPLLKESWAGITLLPLSIAFGWTHDCCKIWAFLTLDETGL